MGHRLDERIEIDRLQFRQRQHGGLLQLLELGRNRWYLRIFGLLRVEYQDDRLRWAKVKIDIQEAGNQTLSRKPCTQSGGDKLFHPLLTQHIPLRAMADGEILAELNQDR